jgi:hypothetical protein
MHDQAGMRPLHLSGLQVLKEELQEREITKVFYKLLDRETEDQLVGV